MREIAERVLFSTSLEEKLQIGPILATDEARGSALERVREPGRPAELRVRADSARVEFPGVKRLEDRRQRGVTLHFLANHELLAAELMALALLRFPDAPAEYRAGVYRALREEQVHTLMYVRRMKESGLEFGELGVNDHFWRVVSPMETPVDFVTRLNLTFEQANLDFSKLYAGAFRQVGDTATASVLEKIHDDEIGHVGHGLAWFRKWKDGGESDWQAFRRHLTFPLTPARAKGVAPFQEESRRRAGLDEDFIRNLKVFEVSRGRTPVVHWFNPNAEDAARAAFRGQAWQPDRIQLALERDLEAVMFGCCRKDDAALMRRPPSVDHLLRLQRAGFELPEILTLDTPPGRKLSGLRPWAWSPDAEERLKPFAGDVSATPWRPEASPEWFSKKIGLRLEMMLGVEHGRFLTEIDEVMEAAARWLGRGEQALLKAPFACAGRGHLRVNERSDPLRTRGWVKNTLFTHGGVVVERWLTRVMDFSALYECHADGRVEPLGLTRMENDEAGRFQAIRVAPKWGSLWEPRVAEFLFREVKVTELYQRRLPPLLGGLLPGYTGPVGVDAMVHGQDGALALRAVTEVNVRHTMGRIAWEWMRKSGAGRLSIHRVGEAKPLGICLNDSAAAEMFLAYWTTEEERRKASRET